MGRDKAQLQLGGRTILDRLIDELNPIVTHLRLIGGEPPPQVLSRPRLTHQPDLHPNGGPLSGIHAALSAAEEPAVFVCACDFPFLDGHFVRGLSEYLVPDVDAVVPVTVSGSVPVASFYRRSCLAVVNEQLEAGVPAARELVLRLHRRELAGEELEQLDPGGRCLFNMNTPEDYRRALAMVAE